MEYLKFVDLTGTVYAIVPLEDVLEFRLRKRLGTFDVIEALEVPKIQAKAGYRVRFNGEDFIVRRVSTTDNKVFIYELESVYSQLLNIRKRVTVDGVDIRYICNYLLEGTQFTLGTLDDELNPVLYSFDVEDNVIKILNILGEINRTFLKYDDNKIHFLKREQRERHDIAFSDKHNLKISEAVEDGYNIFTDVVIVDSSKTKRYRVSNYEYYESLGVSSENFSQFRNELFIQLEREEYLSFLVKRANELIQYVSFPRRGYRGVVAEELTVEPGDVVKCFIGNETLKLVVYEAVIDYKARRCTVQLESPAEDLSNVILKTTEYVKYVVPVTEPVDLDDYVKLNTTYGGLLIDEESGLHLVGSNEEVAIDQFGINPKFVKNFPNKCWNSGFENYDPVTNVPLYWEGATISPNAVWEGDVSAEIPPSGVLIQSPIGGEGLAHPEWWGYQTTRISFRYKWGGVRVEVLRADTLENIPLVYEYTEEVEETLPDGTKQTKIVEKEELRDFLEYPFVENWDGGLVNFRFSPPVGPRIKLKITNLSDTSSAYVDAVQIEPDFTGKWPSIYTAGPKSSFGSSITVEFKRVPYQQDTTIYFSKRYPYPPVVTVGIAYDFGTPGNHSLPTYNMTPHIDCLISQETGINWYYGVRIVWTGGPSSIPNAYTTMTAVCRG